MLYVAGERARPGWVRDRPGAWLAAVGTVCFGAFMGQLDASIVALTYHSIGTRFGATLNAVQWVSLSYLATLAVLLVPVGRISDRIGRKRVYLWGFSAFTVTSLGCAFAPSLGVLIALRALQGGGAAMLQANSVALVTTASPHERLRAALGLQAAAQALGLALGPVIGGVVVQTLGWRWVFALNVPVGVVAVLAGRFLLPRTRLSSDGPVHIGVRDALAPRPVRHGLLGAGAMYLTLFGPIVLVPQLVQSHGATPLHAGLVVAALPAGFALAATLGERMLPSTWTGVRRQRCGLLITVVALAGGAVLAGTNPASTAWCASLAAIGVGLGVATPANNASVMGSARREATALTGGLVSAARAVGTGAATALVAGALAISGGTLAALALLVVAAAAFLGTTRVVDVPE